MKYYILFGPPGAGKGTQASAMVEKYNLCHLSTGELLRKEIAEGTELGKKAKSLIDAGSLVPDEVVEGMIDNAFKSIKGVDGFLLDGFPRTIAQAEALDKMLAAGNEGVTSVISIMIPDEMIKERIRHRATIEGRADDAKRRPSTTGSRLITRRPSRSSTSTRRLTSTRKSTVPAALTMSASPFSLSWTSSSRAKTLI